MTTPVGLKTLLPCSQLLKRLRHENIIGYFASFIEDESLHIVLEYADGGDLSQVIKAKRAKGESFSEKQIMWWFVQLCLAMSYLHNDMRVLHRDLKTQNIFLTHNRQVVKLGDFGIAKVLADTGTMKSMAKSVIGTPFYMSPELCEGKPYNHKSDVWALGCVLYEMATLRHAFDSNSLGALVLKILRGNYPAIDADKYSANLRGLVDWMLKADPADRPSVEQIVQTSWVNRLIKWFRNENTVGNPRADVALVSETIRRGASGQRIAAAAAAAAAAGSRGERLLEPPSPAVAQGGASRPVEQASSSRASSGSRGKDQGSWDAPGAAAEREHRAEQQRNKHGFRPMVAAGSKGVHRTASAPRPSKTAGGGIAISADRRMPPQPQRASGAGSRRASAASDDGRELYPSYGAAANSGRSEPAPPVGDPSAVSYQGYTAAGTAHGSDTPPPPRVPHPSAASTAAGSDVHHGSHGGDTASPHSLEASGDSETSGAAGGTGSSHGSSPLKRGLRQVPERRSVPRPGSFSAMYNTSSINAVGSPSPILQEARGPGGGKQYAFGGGSAAGSHHSNEEAQRGTPATSPVHVHPATKQPLPPPPTAPPPRLTKADATPPSRGGSRRGSTRQSSSMNHSSAISDMDTLSSEDASTLSSGAIRSRLDAALAGESQGGGVPAGDTPLSSSRASAASATSAHSLGARRGHGQGLQVRTSPEGGGVLPEDADLVGISPSRPQIAGGGDVGNIAHRVDDTSAASDAPMLSWRHNTLAFAEDGVQTPGQGGSFVSPLNQARRRSGSSSVTGSPEFSAMLASGRWPTGMNTPTTRSARSASLASATPGAGGGEGMSPLGRPSEEGRRATVGEAGRFREGRAAPQLHLAIDSPTTATDSNDSTCASGARGAAGDTAGGPPTAPRGQPDGQRVLAAEVVSDDGVSSSSPSTRLGVSSLDDSGSRQFHHYGRTAAGGNSSQQLHADDNASNDELSADSGDESSLDHSEEASGAGSGGQAEWEAATPLGEYEEGGVDDGGGFREFDEYGRAVYYDAAFDEYGQPLLDENGDQMYHEYLVDPSQAFEHELQAGGYASDGEQGAAGGSDMEDEQHFLQATVDAAVAQDDGGCSVSSRSSSGRSGSEGGPSDAESHAPSETASHSRGHSRRLSGDVGGVPTYAADLDERSTSAAAAGRRAQHAPAPPHTHEDEFPGDFVHVASAARLPRMSIVKRSAPSSGASSAASSVASSVEGPPPSGLASHSATSRRSTIRRSQSDEVSPVAARSGRVGRLTDEQKAAQVARLRIVDEMATGGGARRLGGLRRGASEEVYASHAAGDGHLSALGDLSERSSVASDAGTENTPSARAAAALRESFGPHSTAGFSVFDGTLSVGRGTHHQRRATVDMRPPPVPASAAGGARRRSDGVVSGLVHKFERMSSQRSELGVAPSAAGAAAAAAGGGDGRARRSSSLSARDNMVQEQQSSGAQSLESSTGTQALVSSWKRGEFEPATLKTAHSESPSEGSLPPARRPERSLPSELKAAPPTGVQLQLPLPDDGHDTPVVTFVPARSRPSATLSVTTASSAPSAVTSQAVYLPKASPPVVVQNGRRLSGVEAAVAQQAESYGRSVASTPSPVKQQQGRERQGRLHHSHAARNGDHGDSSAEEHESPATRRGGDPTSTGARDAGTTRTAGSTSASMYSEAGRRSAAATPGAVSGVSPLLAPARQPQGEMREMALSGVSDAAAYSTSASSSMRRGSTLDSGGMSHSGPRGTFSSPMGTTGGGSSASASTRRRASSDDPSTLPARVAALRQSCQEALGEDVFQRLHAALAASGDGESGLDALAEVDTGTVTVDLVVLAKISKLLRLEDQLADLHMQ